MKTFTVIIRDVVSTDRRVVIEATSRRAARVIAIRLAASRRGRRGPVAGVGRQRFPLFRTLAPTE